MGSTLLKWKEPLPVYWARHKIHGAFMVLQWVALIIFITLLIRNVLQHDYENVFQSIFGVCVSLAIFRARPTYKIGNAGISYRDGYSRMHLRWSDIEWYYISPDETEPNMMQVQFSPTKVKWLKTPPAFVFDLQEIDKEKLLHILERYLPQKELQGLALQQCQ